MKTINVGTSAFKKLFTAGFMVPLIGIALIGFVFTFFAVRKMEAEFWDAIGPTIERLLTTDNMRIIESDAQFFFQIAAFLVFFIYFVLNNQTIQGCIKQRADKFRIFVGTYGDQMQEKLHDHLQDDLFLAVQPTLQFQNSIKNIFQKDDAFKDYGEAGKIIRLTNDGKK